MAGTSHRTGFTLVPSREGQELALQFVWTGDRYEHRITASIDGHEIVIAKSVEAIGVDDQRELPTFQELSVESIGGADVACLVGMSAKAYWSASVERTSSEGGLLFDLSCKGATMPQLTCEYVLQQTLRVVRPGEVLIDLDERRCCKVTALPIGANNGEIISSFDRLAIHGPSQTFTRSAPRRSKYQWRLLHRDEIA